MGGRVKFYRKSMNISQTELADAVGVSRKAISALECHNVKPNFEVMLRIASYLDIPTAYLFRDGGFKTVIVSLFDGSSRLSPEGSLTGAGLAELVSDFRLNGDDMLCIISGNRVYAAARKIADGASFFICADKDGVCRLCRLEMGEYKTVTGEMNVTAPEVIASVVGDVTESISMIM
ncbi:MAG: helix-turn-helix transcriptional regulator [Clostridia bacterium]|nr:helix-turn-helix transcriptional regulator [Clostridia bacterium]